MDGCAPEPRWLPTATPPAGKLRADARSTKTGQAANRNHFLVDDLVAGIEVEAEEVLAPLVPDINEQRQYVGGRANHRPRAQALVQATARQFEGGDQHTRLGLAQPLDPAQLVQLHSDQCFDDRIGEDLRRQFGRDAPYSPCPGLPPIAPRPSAPAAPAAPDARAASRRRTSPWPTSHPRAAPGLRGLGFAYARIYLLAKNAW